MGVVLVGTIGSVNRVAGTQYVNFEICIEVMGWMFCSYWLTKNIKFLTMHLCLRRREFLHHLLVAINRLTHMKFDSDKFLYQ